MSRVEKPRVLLADDNEATCTLLTALLQREFLVDVVMDGQDAIENLRTRSYAAVLIDLRMPLVDGFGVLEFLQQNAPPMLEKVLVVTAVVAPRELDRARSFGVCGIITKPFEVDVLLAAVKQCTSSTDGASFSNVLCTSTPVILLLADLLRQRLM